MDLVNWLAIFISLGALAITFLSFRRDGSLQNENTLHSKKIDVYCNILLEMNKLLNALEENILNAEAYLENPTVENIETLDYKADTLDDCLEIFKNYFISNSLLIPIEVLNLIQNFADANYKIEIIDSNSENLIQAISILQQQVEELYTQADFISEAMRSDLHIDALNRSIFKRLRN